MTASLIARAGSAAYLAGVCLAVAACGNTQSQPDVTARNQDEVFVWHLLHAQRIFLLEENDGFLYPARRIGDQVFESLPPQITAQLYAGGSDFRVPVNEIASPLRVQHPAWSAQIRRDDDWLPEVNFKLEEATYAVQMEADGAWLSVAPGDVRFREVLSQSSKASEGE